MLKDSRLLIAGLAFLWGMCAACSSPQPEYWPVCTSPQPIAPIQDAGVYGASYWPPIVWNGQDFACLINSGMDGYMNFRRFYADGTPATDILQLFPAGSGALGDMVWNGNGYGVAYQFYDGSYYVIHFCRLSADGTPIGSPIQISFVGDTPAANCQTPTIAWSGSVYAIAWTDDRNGDGANIYTTLLDSDGNIINSGAGHDIVVCAEANTQGGPSITWATAREFFFIVWTDSRLDPLREIYCAGMPPEGVPWTFGPIVSDIGNVRRPNLIDTGTYLGMVWEDNRDGNYEVYFARINPAQYTKMGSDVRLTNNTGSSNNAKIVWTGAEYGVFWSDNTSGESNIMFQRVSPAGVPQGGNILIEPAIGMTYPCAAFANDGFMVTGKFDASSYVIPWGCAAVDTPTCPGGFVAYNITGTTATIGWLPSSDAAQDIAYYQVYRNAVPIAKTSSTFYNDTGLSVGGTYAYAVQPVNAGQVQNTSCQTTFYVKTNASLTLTVAKNDNGSDAELLWNDAGMSSYNVFRGTSPQVMSQIGATDEQQYNDPNVLMDSNIYYYTVDEPGW